MRFMPRYSQRGAAAINPMRMRIAAASGPRLVYVAVCGAPLGREPECIATFGAEALHRDAVAAVRALDIEPALVGLHLRAFRCLRIDAVIERGRRIKHRAAMRARYIVGGKHD